MANYSQWEDIKKTKGEPSTESRAAIEQGLELGQLIYDMRTEAGLSQREMAERMETTQSVISRLEEGGDAKTGQREREPLPGDFQGDDVEIHALSSPGVPG